MSAFSNLIAKCSNDLFLMADIGLTCGGNIDRTFELISIAKEVGFDGVKLQLLESAKLLGDTSVTYTYPTLNSGKRTEVMLDMFKKLEFSDDQWNAIVNYIRELGMEPIVTCHYEGGVERVNKLDLNFNKICTWSLSHHRLIKKLAQNGRPLIIDTGTINEKDLMSLNLIYRDAGGGELIVLHDFHTDNLAEMNFAAMSRLSELGFNFGYTPQGRKDWLDFMSVGYGVKILEKRLTLSRDIPENGHWKAHEPSEIKEWVKNIRECKKAIGVPKIMPTSQDLEDARKYYKSAWLIVDKNAGDAIEESDVVFKRPGTGISSAYWEAEFQSGAYLKGSVAAGTMLTREMLQ